MATSEDLSPIKAKEAAEKIANKIDKEQTRSIFWNIVAAIFVAHFVLTLFLDGGGIMGYLNSWQRILSFMLSNPVIGAAVPISFFALYKGIEFWRHPDPDTIVLPEFPPVPDLRWENSVYVGSGWTRSGKQPGDVVDQQEDDILEDPHVILTEKGLFGNAHIKGGVGSGKTSTFIQPFTDQVINKYPHPPDPDLFTLGEDGTYILDRASGERGMLPALLEEMQVDAEQTYRDVSLEKRWNPYVGMTPQEAQEEYDRLLDLHEKHKWGMFIVDPKGDLTEFVRRSAAMANREDDVVVLQPGGEYTYNPLNISHNPLVQAEMVMDGIEAVSGQSVHQYYRSTMSEWIANALAILQVVHPTQVTFKTILQMARSETLRARWVAEAERVMQDAQERAAELRRMGKEYEGVRIDPQAIQFFRDWDDPDSDRNRQRAVLSGIKSQSKYFVDDEIAPFLCPEMPPTFAGFDKMIDDGQIVVLRTPLGEYGPVGEVLGILMLADAQRAALERVNRDYMNQERVVAFIVDEIAAYINRQTKKFIAKNRQSRVAFLGAHQSQGQLIEQYDKSNEQSFNDNLRTKISYNAPNAEAARRESNIFGQRKTVREVWTESQSFGQVERSAGSDSIKPGRESQGASRRIEESEEYWFEPEEFMSLETGECVIRVFDGTTTRPPRKIEAPAYWRMERSEVANQLEVDNERRPPHPMVVISPQHESIEYLNSAIGGSGYIIIEPLADQEGVLTGFKFITSMGTVVAALDSLEEYRDLVVDLLGDESKLIAFTHIQYCSLFFVQQMGVQFERVIDLPALYKNFYQEARGEDFYQLIAHETGRRPPYERVGAWEFHLQATPVKRKHIVQYSRQVIELYTHFGAELHELGGQTLEQVYEDTLEAIQHIIEHGGGEGEEGEGGGGGAQPTPPERGEGGGGEELRPREEEPSQPEQQVEEVTFEVREPETEAEQPSSRLGELDTEKSEGPAPETASREDTLEEQPFEGPSAEAEDQPAFEDELAGEVAPLEADGDEDFYARIDEEYGEDPFGALQYPENLSEEPTMDALPAEGEHEEWASVDEKGGEESPEPRDEGGAPPLGPEAFGQPTPEDVSVREESSEEPARGQDLRFSEETREIPGLFEEPEAGGGEEPVSSETASEPSTENAESTEHAPENAADSTTSQTPQDQKDSGDHQSDRRASSRTDRRDHGSPAQQEDRHGRDDANEKEDTGDEEGGKDTDPFAEDISEGPPLR